MLVKNPSSPGLPVTMYVDNELYMLFKHYFSGLLRRKFYLNVSNGDFVKAFISTIAGIPIFSVDKLSLRTSQDQLRQLNIGKISLPNIAIGIADIF
jgi:hypothetical protein